MHISEAAEKTGLTPVTLRYYERIGLIPPIKRKSGGVRRYAEDDLNWIEFIKCMRGAGLSIESLIEYTTLYQKGGDTLLARKEILLEERANLLARQKEINSTLSKLEKKIQHYDEEIAKTSL